MRTVFLFLVTSLTALLTYRVLWPLCEQMEVFWAVAAIFAYGWSVLMWMLFVYWSSDSTEVSRVEMFLEKSAHVTMGMISLLLFCDLIREIVGIFYPEYRGVVGSALVLAGASILFVCGFLVAMLGPVVRRVKVSSPLLPSGFNLRIVQLSDLHVGSWIRKAFVEKVVTKVQSLGEIDLVALTGDIGDGNPARHREDLAPLGKIQSRFGGFSVSGNHEGYWSESDWNEEIRRLGYRVLENHAVRLSKNKTSFNVIGIPDLRSDLKKASATTEVGDFNLLLAHQPKHAEEAEDLAISLQLSGHTHAGQFVPWSWMIGLFHRYAKGLYEKGRFAIYVNSGTGFWGPPIRLGTRSEITLLEIEGKLNI